MWYGLFDPADGNRLVSITSRDEDAAAAPGKGLGVFSQADDPRRPGWQWDAAAAAWQVVAVPPPPLTRLQFRLRFTQAERLAIKASDDPVVADFMDMLGDAQEVVASDPATIAGLGYLEGQGLIGTGRAAEILTWQ